MYMLFANKKTRYKKLLIILIPLFVSLIVCAFFAYSSISSVLGIGNFSGGKKYDIDSLDYHLRSNATDYQKELFNELKELINDESDDLAISECVVKNYIADTYTWNNKKGQWDVGGMCYIYSPMKVNFYLKAKDEFYGLLNKYIDEYANDELLEVSNIEVTSSYKGEDKYEVDGNTYDNFVVKAKWEYTPESKFAQEVDNNMFFVVIKNDNGRYEIVVNYENY